MSSPGIEPGPRPSQGRVRVRHTPRTSIETGRCRAPHPGIEPGLAASKAAVRPPHSRGKRASALARSRTWSSTFGGSRAVRHTPRASSEADGRIRTGMSLLTRQGPRRSATSASEQGRKDSNPVREFWRLAALPGAHPCKGPRPVRCRGVVSSIRRGAGPARAAGTAPSSRPGRRGRRRAASTRAGPAAPEPHAGLLRGAVGLAGVARTHAATQLVQLDTPPCDRGTTWSIVIASQPGWAPQYWQV